MAFNTSLYTWWQQVKKSISLSNFCSGSTQAPLKWLVFKAVVSQQKIWALSSRFQSTIDFQLACVCFLPLELFSLGTVMSCSLSPYEITMDRRSSFNFQARKADNSLPSQCKVTTSSTSFWKSIFVFCSFLPFFCLNSLNWRLVGNLHHLLKP